MKDKGANLKKINRKESRIGILNVIHWIHWIV
jgi:hypothetical protein